MSMDDPRDLHDSYIPRDPSLSRQPYVHEEEGRSRAGWIFSAIAAIFVVAIILWGLSDRFNTASTPTNPPAATTGQGGRNEVVRPQNRTVTPAQPERPAQPDPQR